MGPGDRGFLWPLAWACLPLALLIDFTVARAPEESARLFLQAAVHADAEDWAEARARFVLAATADPTATLPAHNAAIVAREQGDLAAARAWNEETLRRNPGFGPARALRRELGFGAARAPGAESLDEAAAARPGPGLR